MTGSGPGERDFRCSHVNYWHSAEAAARVLGVALTRLELRSVEDIEPAFDKLPAGFDRGLMVLPHLITASNRKAIIQLAAGRRIPAVYGVRFFAKDGGLVSYGVDSQICFAAPSAMLIASCAEKKQANFRSRRR